ncbi:DUF6730 family protein [Sinomicrobium weinanense]|uniref:Uncharacterized protein n=1 Tax=Sinomicrobium weinanense TaxID=2842200 RepID=A0A926JQB9_9FLAO|nr:DUF6730 family protein [Sinomicrobium weinanense]MBC9795424.1 hypothetical protein [Sinomicrobium weinanense]MBU3123949.1 hypothetical protein [Sinomicrobium weinanense]
MAKVEEIAELLTEEIHGFNISIERLQKLSEHLGDIKIKADATEVEHLLKQHLNEYREIQSRHNENLTEVYKEVKGTYWLPRWLVISFIVVYALTLVSLIYTVHLREKRKSWEEKYERVIRYYKVFMEENPEAKALYENWLNEEK